ncbi:MAG: N-acetyltransferase family protein [Bryobacteraceae bacterium]|jgi:phosphinothricin acetyltransferase
MVIDALKQEDWEPVRDIYLQGIATGHATFQQDAPDWPEWDRGHLVSCRLVARSESRILGWAALSPVSRRPVYAGVGEVSVYIRESARGQGIGKALLSTLIDASERARIRTLQAGIFPENTASIELHRKLGFRVVGIRERMGCKHGQWRDVRLMERRSTVAGI